MCKDWYYIGTLIHKITTYVSLRDHLYKLQNQWYLTLSGLAKMYSIIPDSCWRCKLFLSMFIHVWWNCSVVRSFGEPLRKEMEKILGFEIPFLSIA